MTANFAHGASIVFVITMGKIMLKNFFVFRALIDGTVPNDRQQKWGGRARPERSYHISRPISGAATTVIMPASIITRLDTTPSCGPSS